MTAKKNRDRFSERQKNVENLLSAGKHSVTEITIKLGYADPRSYIRYLRHKGVNVQDEWVQNNNVRYKMYWVAPKLEIGRNNTVTLN